MAVAAGAQDHIAYTDDPRILGSIVQKARVHPEGVASAILRVQEAHDMAQGNVNPQLILTDLLRGLREDLVGDGFLIRGREK